MKTDAFESDLRQALGSRAAEVPAEAVDRLQQRDYRPRQRSRVTLAGAGLVIAALAASAGAYLGEAGSAGGRVPARMAKAAGTTVRLEGYTFALPAGFKIGHTTCTPPKRGGLHGVPVKQSKWFEAGAAAHDGCVEAVLSAAELTPPPHAVPVQIGRYQGYLASQPQGHGVALFTDIAGSGSYRWLVVLARNLSGNQVVNMADRALGQRSCPPAGSEVNGKSCP